MRKWHVSKNFKSIADFFDERMAVEYALTLGSNVKVRDKYTGEIVFDSEDANEKNL